jgi:DNA-binding MarR family transcriptional regulator
LSNSLDVGESLAIANALRPILLRLARHLRSEVHSSGLTAGQLAILIAVEFNPGMTAQKLAEREGLSEAGVSGHLALLEGKGLIWRERIVDRRRVGVFLTGEGRELLAGVRHRRTEWLTERLELLSHEQRELIRAALPALDDVSMDER